MIIDGDGIKAFIAGGLEQPLQKRWGDFGVGGEISQHRGVFGAGGGEARADHAAAFADAGDGDRLSIHLEFGGRHFAARVGGEDRVGKEQGMLFAIAQIFSGFGDSVLDFVHGKKLADDAGGGGDNFVSLAFGEGGGQFAHLSGIALAPSARTGIGVAAVDDSAAKLGGDDVLAGDHDRRGDDFVGGEKRGRGGRGIAQQQSHVRRLAALDSGINPRRPKTCWRKKMKLRHVVLCEARKLSQRASNV